MLLGGQKYYEMKLNEEINKCQLFDNTNVKIGEHSYSPINTVCVKESTDPAATTNIDKIDDKDHEVLKKTLTAMMVKLNARLEESVEKKSSLGVLMKENEFKINYHVNKTRKEKSRLVEHEKEYNIVSKTGDMIVLAIKKIETTSAIFVKEELLKEFFGELETVNVDQVVNFTREKRNNGKKLDMRDVMNSYKKTKKSS